MKKMPIAAKIILIVVLVVSVVLASAFSYFIIDGRKGDLDNAYVNTESLAKENALAIKSQLEIALDGARTLAQAVSAFEEFPLDSRREICTSMLSEIIEVNEKFIGGGICFAENALDGLDADYINSELSDETGRFIPYCGKGENGLEFGPLVDYEVEGVGDYYLVPLRTGREYITEPYEYEVAGEIVVMATVSAPISNASGEVVGMVGIDIALDELNHIEFNSGTYSSAKTTLLSNSGSYVIHPDSTLVGENIDNVEPEKNKVAEMLTSIKEGNIYITEGISNTSGENSLKIMVPVLLGQTQINWSTGVSVDMDEITAESNANMLLFIIIFIAVIGAIIIGTRIAVVRIIKKPLTQLVSVAEQQAEGNYDLEINVDREDEIGVLFKSLSAVNDKMNHLLLDLKNSSNMVASGAEQISDGSQELSQGTTEQASAIEQLSASIEQISAQTKINANNAIEVNTLADSSKANADKGNEKMENLLTAMDDINVSSNNISNIIKVIDDIAFQTNILALNAAVEAARAGQHGKGFAVVAEEVRNLASRSAEAAKESSAMINESMNKVNDGSKIASETAQMLIKIKDDINDVARLINNINTASNEQSIGITQINDGINQVAQVVQANSSTAEQSAAASEQLRAQAESLKEQASQFKLKNDNY